MTGHDHHHHHHHDHSSGFSLTWTVAYAAKGWQIKEGRLLICLIILLIGSSLYEILSGILKHEGYLISEGFHSLFQSFSVYIALIALSYSLNNSNPDKKCTFGYGRTQVVIAFGNAIFGFFVNIFGIFEIFHHLIEGNSEILGSFPVHALMIKVIIEILIYLGLSNYSKNELQTSVSDNLGVISIQCLGLIISECLYITNFYVDFTSLSQFNFPVHVINPSLNALWILISLCLLKPYITKNGRILLMCAPSGDIREEIIKKFREISILEGVREIKNEKLWMINEGALVCSIVIVIEKGAKGETVLEKSQEILNVFSHLNIEIELENTDLTVS